MPTKSGQSTQPINFAFNNGMVTGPGDYTFDYNKAIKRTSNPDWYAANPQGLIHWLYEDWNKRMNPGAVTSGLDKDYLLGTGFDITGLPDANALSAGGEALIPQLADWGQKALAPYLKPQAPPATTQSIPGPGPISSVGSSMPLPPLPGTVPPPTGPATSPRRSATRSAGPMAGRSGLLGQIGASMAAPVSDDERLRKQSRQY